MTLITLSAFWKGILIGFCLGYSFALVTLGALGLLLLDRQENQDSRRRAADNAQLGKNTLPY